MQGLERPGLFYVNTHHLAQRPTWQVDVLTLHEAIPGHHLQASVMWLCPIVAPPAMLMCDNAPGRV